ncbi:MAG: ATP-grasp domain-containing protein [Flavobacteriaceae bacterium]|nr:ATP-grasp domain-containing protein [Flavobacteriaceae bacterium]
MILIDYPFVSDFLKKTIKENNFEIIATSQAKELINDISLNWVSEKEAKEVISNNPETLVYTNSENSISWVFKNLKETKLPHQIQFFKDKLKFRELVQDLFPDFFFKTVELDDIQNLEVSISDFPFVIKPVIGFFSIGVHIVHNSSDWETAKKELNYENLKSMYPKNVMDASTFIIEEYIEGEEFAIDCYFDDDGNAVILNILHHKFSSGNDVSDRLYSTSRNIIQTYKKSIEAFLNPIGNKAGLKNFPMHIEVRIDASRKIVPIEVNPLRFGGWCTTADLTWHAYGINSYEYFLNGKKPNWNEIFKIREDKIYSIVLLNNNSGIESSEIVAFDFELLQNDLENILEIRELDIKKDPVFGFVFTETSKDNKQEIMTILNSDLRRYIKV